VSRRGRIFVVVGLGAALGVAAVVTASVVAAGSSRSSARITEPASSFAGIPQHGTVLGSPRAPVTLVEFADLQCPYCGEFARVALPTLVRDYVRTGKVRIVFQGLEFLGADSDAALRSVLAAARQGRGWQMLDGLFRRQGLENSGWVTDPLLRTVRSAGSTPPGCSATRHASTPTSPPPPRSPRAHTSTRRRRSSSAGPVGRSGTSC
jgi:protein-disulfide isomerase